MKNNLNYSNLNYFNTIKNSLKDPLGKEISQDLKWVKLNQRWGSSQYPVAIVGDGSPIILLHGFDSCFLEFRRVYPLLKKNFKLIIPDLFGFGFTPRVFNQEVTPENIISNLIDLIEALDIKGNLNIVGASMGGSVALSLSKDLSNRLQKIVLLSPAGLFTKPKSIPIPFNQIGAAFLGTPYVRKNLCRQAFAYPDKSVGVKEEQIASAHLGCKGWRNSLASFAKSGGFGGTEKFLNDLRIKTICGENDRILGQKELLRLKKEKKLNALLLKNCGHLPHLDKPSITAKIIFDFFNEK